MAEAGLVNRTIVYCPDRLGRDVYEALAAMREFKRLKIGVDFVVQSFDDTPEGVLQFQVLLAVAEFERKIIARLLDQAPSCLRRGGALFAEIGEEQGDSARRLAMEQFPRARVDVKQDLSGLDRVLVVRT